MQPAVPGSAAPHDADVSGPRSATLAPGIELRIVTEIHFHIPQPIDVGVDVRIRQRIARQQVLTAGERAVENAQAVTHGDFAAAAAFALCCSAGTQSDVLRTNLPNASPNVTLDQTTHFIASPRSGPGSGYKPFATPKISPRYSVMAADSQIALPS